MAGEWSGDFSFSMEKTLVWKFTVFTMVAVSSIRERQRQGVFYILWRWTDTLEG